MTKRELERLKEDFEKGVYVKKSTTALLIAMTLCLGLFLGNLLTILTTNQQPVARQQVNTQQSAPAQPQVNQAQVNRILELERLTRNDPSNVGAWQQLGNAYYDTSRPKDAIKAYTKSLELDSNYPNVWTDLGTMYRRNGQPTKAVEAYNEALKRQPGHKNALFNRGIVLYNDLGKKQEGLNSWKRLLALNPSATTPQGKSLKAFIEAHENAM